MIIVRRISVMIWGTLRVDTLYSCSQQSIEVDTLGRAPMISNILLSNLKIPYLRFGWWCQDRRIQVATHDKEKQLDFRDTITYLFLPQTA